MYQQSYFSGDFSTYTLKYVNKLPILQTIFIKNEKSGKTV